MTITVAPLTGAEFQAAIPHLARLRIELPDGSELLLVHGSPADPTEPITHDMSDEDIRGLLSDDPADIIVCGGSHIPFDRTVMGVRIVNVGSVGQAISTGGPRHADATFTRPTPPAPEPSP